jgi:hypothetical protein
VKKTGFTHDSVDNKTVDWYTPKWIFDEMGIQFDLDPCQPKEKIEWIPATHHFCEEDDGLSQVWRDNVWLNPPYGKFTKAWLEKLNEHGEGIALVFARTDCKWFHDVCAKANGILFLKGRVKFVDGLGVTGGGGAGSGSMLVAWGQDNADVLKSMSNRGFYISMKA